MTGLKYLKVTVADRIATVLLNRPPVNAVTQEMYREITEFFSTADELADAVVLSGAGKHFCGGNDLGEFATLTPDNADARMKVVRTAFFAIQDCAVPVVGAVNGTAVGTGLAIAASCDFVIAADDARIGTPEIGVGVMGEPGISPVWCRSRGSGACISPGTPCPRRLPGRWAGSSTCARRRT